MVPDHPVGIDQLLVDVSNHRVFRLKGKQQGPSAHHWLVVSPILLWYTLQELFNQLSLPTSSLNKGMGEFFLFLHNQEACFILHPWSYISNLISTLNPPVLIILPVLEIFAELLRRHEIYEKLPGIATKNVPQTEIDRYSNLVKRIWDNQWEWWPSD